MSTKQELVVPQKLLEAVAADIAKRAGFHDYEGKLSWIKERAAHYESVTGVSASEILAGWEKGRTYWYMNYYQEANQPRLDDGSCRVFDTLKDFQESAVKCEFRCPSCEGVSTDPYECNSGTLLVDKLHKERAKEGKTKCNWKSYGLLRTLGKGVTIFIKSEMRSNHIFMPIAWEGQSK